MRTVGCRANQADSAALLRALCGGPAVEVGDLASADVVLVNTCCVTREAERDCRKIVSKALRESDRAIVAVVGCAVNAIPGFGSGLGGRVVTRAWDSVDAHGLAGWIEELARARLEGGDEPRPHTGEVTSRRTRALLKVQSGCGHGCAYCIVPRARGPERSVPMDEAIAAAARLAGEGYREIVLTGVQLGAWGSDLGGRPRLAELVARVADAVAPGRVRVSSVEPWSVDDALLDVVAGHPRVCPHLHVPLQSGDDRVLALMGRGYRLADFEAVAAAARARIPGLALGTDVLCGFPTETAEEHARTLAAIERIGFAYLHAFPFSPRPGTRAAGMGSAPGRKAAKERVLEARALGARAWSAFLEARRGEVREAIVEESRGGGARGLTEDFVPVEIAGPGLEAGALVDVELGGRGRGNAARAVVISLK